MAFSCRDMSSPIISSKSPPASLKAGMEMEKNRKIAVPLK